MSLNPEFSQYSRITGKFIQPNIKGLKGLLSWRGYNPPLFQTQTLKISFSMIPCAVSALQMLINYSKNTIEMTAEFIISTIVVFVITGRQSWTFPNCDNLGIGAVWHIFHDHDWQQLQYLTIWGKEQTVWWADGVSDSISTFRLQQNISVNKVQGQGDLAVEDYNSYWSWQELCQLVQILRLVQTVHFQILPFIAYFVISAYSLLL